MSQCFDGIHVGGAERGVDAEHDADERGDGKGEHGRPGGYNGGHGGDMADDNGNGHADDDTDCTACAGKNDGFNEELENDVPLLGAQGATDADFPGAFRNAGKHDVHDADAAHQQRYSGDGAENGVKNLLGSFRLTQQFQRYCHFKVFLLVLLRKNAVNNQGGFFNIFNIRHLYNGLVQFHPFRFKGA